MDCMSMRATQFGEPNDDVLKQATLSEATCLLLKAHLRHLRRSLGVLNRTDELEQYAEDEANIAYFREHNFFLYLVFIHRFDIIRELFDYPDLDAELALMAEIEAEEAAKEERMQHQAETPIPKSSAIIPISTRSTTTEPPYTNLELYGYYEKAHQNILYAHEVKQAKVYDAAYQARYERMNNVIKVLEQDKTVSDADKLEIKELQKNYKDERDAIMSTPIVNADGSPSLDAAKAQHQAMQALDDKYALAFDKILEKHSNNNPVIAEIKKEEQEAIQSYKKELADNDTDKQNQVQSIMPHLERTREASKKDIDNNLSAILTEIEKCPTDTLKPDEKTTLDTAVTELKSYKEQLQTADSHEKTQALLTQCDDKLKTIETIINPVLPTASKTTFETKTAEFHNMVNAPPAPTEAPNLKKGFNDYKQEMATIKSNNDDANLKAFKENIDDIVGILERKKNSGDLSPEDLAMINQTKNLLQEIKEYSNYQEIPPDHITALNENFNKLSDQYEALEQASEKFSSSLEEFKNLSQSSLKR